jgi:ABC-type branched-subunit amino acid transport system substrate-binding protein
MIMFAVFSSARKSLSRFALAVATLAVAACEPIPGAGLGGGASGPSGESVTVALLVPSGSGNPTDDLLAQSLENAARLAMRDLNGVTVDLRVYPTAANSDLAAANAAKAVDEGAEIILGPVYASAANAAGTAVAGRGVNVIAFSNNAEIAGGNVFVLGQTFRDSANRVVGYAVDQGKSRFVIVHGNDVAGRLGRDAVANAVAARGATVTASVDYALSQQSVISRIPAMKSAVESTAADALFMTSDSASALPLLTQLLPEAGINSQVAQFMGLTRWDIPPQTLNLPGVQNGWFAVPDPGASARFSSEYQAAYGRAPHLIGGLAFDGIAAIGALASRGGGNALSAAALTQSAGFRGAGGIFRFLPDGTNQRGLAVATIRDAQVAILSAAPQSFGSAGF